MTTLDVPVPAPRERLDRRYSQQLHALVEEQTREYTLGLALIAAEEFGYAKPREGEQVRDLLDDAIARAYKRDRDAYRNAVRLGRAELARRRTLSETEPAPASA